MRVTFKTTFERENVSSCTVSCENANRSVFCFDLLCYSVLVVVTPRFTR